MKPRNLIVLLVILAVLAVIAYSGLKERTSTPGVFEGKGKNLCKDFYSQAVEKIEIEKGGTSVTLEKTANHSASLTSCAMSLTSMS